MFLYVVNVGSVMAFAYLTFKYKHIGGMTLRSMSGEESLSSTGLEGALMNNQQARSLV